MTQTEISKMYGQYMGHLHAGYALQLLAETFSSTPETGDGGVIINKALLSRQDLYTKLTNTMRLQQRLSHQA